MPASPLRSRLDEAAAVLRARDARPVDIAVVLGSGLSPYAATLVDATSVSYRNIPHMPAVSIPGHSGTLYVGALAGSTGANPSVRIAALAGRVHLYEGYAPDEVVFGVRLLITLGARIVVLTNAAGGIAAGRAAGDLVLISDHINLQARNPLIGPNDDSLGPRFPDMTTVYDAELRSLAHAAARSVGETLHEGVYAALAGPSYETPAEIRMLRTLGADLVGMSTVPEALAARHMGARVLGISCVTNLAAGVSTSLLSHDEVEHTARATRTRFASVLDATLRSLGSLVKRT